MKLLKWDGCLTVTPAHFGSLYMLPIPCSIASSDNYLIIKACSSSITGRATPSTVKSVSSRWAFLLRPTFISRQRKVSK